MGELAAFRGRSLRMLRTPVNDTPTAVNARHATLRYLPGLDGLRAISVLAVIVFHHYFVFGAERGWLPGGFLGVEVFFVVSGYLITSLLLAERRETGRVSLQELLAAPRPAPPARGPGAARGRRRVLAAVPAGQRRTLRGRRRRRADLHQQLVADHRQPLVRR